MIKAIYDYLTAVHKFCDEHGIEKEEFPLVLPREMLYKIIDQEWYVVDPPLKAMREESRGFSPLCYQFNNKNYELIALETFNKETK